MFADWNIEPELVSMGEEGKSADTEPLEDTRRQESSTYRLIFISSSDTLEQAHSFSAPFGGKLNERSEHRLNEFSKHRLLSKPLVELELVLGCNIRGSVIISCEGLTTDRRRPTPVPAGGAVEERSIYVYLHWHSVSLAMQASQAGRVALHFCSKSHQTGSMVKEVEAYPFLNPFTVKNVI